MDASFSRRLWDRRVPHILGLYAGALVTATTFADMLTSRYGLSPYLVDALLLALLIAIPGVVLAAWAHGAPGAQKWSWRQGALLSCNGLVLLTLLGFTFHDKPLGRTTQTITAEVDGESKERTVASAEFRQRLGVFYFAADDQVLGRVVANALAVEASQSLYVNAWGPSAFAERLRRAGNADGFGVPGALQRELAEKERMDAYVAGTVETTASGVRITARLMDTETGSERAKVEAEGALLKAIDEAAAALHAALDLPARDTRDLPTGDLLTANEDALRAWSEGSHALAYEQSSPEALAALNRATEADPTFAYAHLIKATPLTRANQWDAAEKAIVDAQRHQYRLSESNQQGLRVYAFYIQRQPEQALTAAQEWQALHPDDPLSHSMTAGLAQMQGRDDIATESMRAGLRADPAEIGLHLSLGRIYEKARDYDASADAYAAYVEAEPELSSGHIALARIAVLRGDPAAALEHSRRAAAVEPDNMTAQMVLAGSLIRVGEAERGLALVPRLLEQDLTPQQRLLVHDRAMWLYDALGLTDSFIASRDSSTALLTNLYDETHALRTLAGSAFYLVPHGRADRAQADLKRARAHPMYASGGTFAADLDLGQASVDVSTGDLAGAEQQIERASAAFAEYGHDIDATFISAIRGRLAMASGDPGGAAETLAPYIRSNPGSLFARVWRAQALAASGERDAALRVLGEVLAAAPHDGDAHLALAKVLGAETAAGKRHLRAALYTWSNASSTFAPAAEARRLLGGLALPS